MRLIKLGEVLESTGLGRSTVYKYISEGTFPRPVSLGKRNRACVESEVQDWILDKITRRDEGDE
ncbi:helix-turn-helix transcriptional regulator [Halomonas tibetensis]|uniref:Helix-turn-helix transcriptional regulator n=1 Tax=Halomonas tibetensis TaxID=2259590 RepID=A0ABV7B6X4_9GAMM